MLKLLLEDLVEFLLHKVHNQTAFVLALVKHLNFPLSSIPDLLAFLTVIELVVPCIFEKVCLSFLSPSGWTQTLFMIFGHLSYLDGLRFGSFSWPEHLWKLFLSLILLFEFFVWPLLHSLQNRVALQLRDFISRNLIGDLRSLTSRLHRKVAFEYLTIITSKGTWAIIRLLIVVELLKFLDREVNLVHIFSQALLLELQNEFLVDLNYDSLPCFSPQKEAIYGTQASLLLMWQIAVSIWNLLFFYHLACATRLVLELGFNVEAHFYETDRLPAYKL